MIIFSDSKCVFDILKFTQLVNDKEYEKLAVGAHFLHQIN